jgi:hypothetical protein
MPLPADEYNRRRKTLDALRRLSVAECVEVARILKAHGVPYSANATGILFDLAALEQPVMDALYRFIDFTDGNAAALAAREAELSTLVAAQSPLGDAKAPA